jgi:hypothetical protein
MAGYRAHIYYRDTVCAGCKKANNDYHREHRKTHPERRAYDRRTALARSRALERLAKLHPTEFKTILREERLADDLSLRLVGDSPNSSRGDSSSNSDADPLASSDAVRQGEGER